ncbi:hypothetical protein TCAL_15896 [Tigriopus californicus]|uniref:Uncharacterized protein n=1 Tax=Tigriopus californicus TaxID=6832 RepID=A0A553PHU1_TIGCA|nr:hypothetical protein TCAL_15896 [Tigriopus californicus]
MKRDRRDTMPGSPSWLELVIACDKAGLDLASRHSVWPQMTISKLYDIWGATCIELEVDMLTGEKTVRRADVYGGHRGFN